MKSSSLPIKITSEIKQEEGYLQAKLDTKIQALIPIKQTKGAVIIPLGKITVMPNIPKWVIGLFNQRSHVFWLIDLPHLLQLSSVRIKPREYSVVIVQVGNISLGLVVEEIQGVIRFSEDKIQPLMGSYSSGLTPYLKGCIVQPPTEMLLVLDTQAIIEVASTMISPV